MALYGHYTGRPAQGPEDRKWGEMEVEEEEEVKVGV